MGVSPRRLAELFPHLYHMAELGSWPSIVRHGLLSTSALLDLYGIAGQRRVRLQSRHRPENVSIAHSVHGAAVIRDQKPMSDEGLTRALLDGLTPEEWYRDLNSRVFFWLTEDRLARLMNARAYRAKRHTVLTVDTKLLLDRHADRVALSPINSGCTKPMPHPRGRDTFRRLADYPFEEWSKKRPLQDSIVELAVDNAVPDIRDLVIEVKDVGADLPDEFIWRRG